MYLLHDYLFNVCLYVLSEFHEIQDYVGFVHHSRLSGWHRVGLRNICRMSSKPLLLSITVLRNHDFIRLCNTKQLYSAKLAIVGSH